VREAAKRAGFEVVGSSDLLRNPADDLSSGVFDPAIRGHTDRFLLKLRKPM
jgi:predicted methyltransferase